MTTPDFFPESYEAARIAFRERAAQVKSKFPNAVIASKLISPLSADNLEDLTVDELYLPPQDGGPLKTLWILTSGVHGLEAATGSAIQAMFLDEIWPKLEAPGVGIWLVHCLNPWGFQHGRRVTEANINLNRNFAPDPKTFKTPNIGYRKLAAFIERPGRVHYSKTSTLQTLAFLARHLLSREFNADTLNQAIGQGQFEFPRGLEFGGHAREPQVQYFIDRFLELSASYEDVLLCDLHTGLGEKGRLHVIPGSDQRACANPELVKKFFRLGTENDLYAFTPSDQKGFYKTVGDLNSLVAALAKPSQRVLALTLEFGTLGNGFKAKLETLNRLWLENRGHHGGYANEKSELTIRRLYRQIFEPTDSAWRANALGLARHLLSRFAARL